MYKCIECGNETKHGKKYCSCLCHSASTRRKSLMEERNLEIFTLAINGYNSIQIQKIFNITRERVRQILLTYNLTFRDDEVLNSRVVTVQFSKCLYCGKEFLIKRCKNKFCSKKCLSDHYYKYCSRDESERIKYKSVKRPKKRYSTLTIKGIGFVYKHRYIMEKHLGRKLDSYEHVHHIDGNSLNNDISNLEIINQRDHARLTIKKEMSTYRNSPVKIIKRKMTVKQKKELTKSG